MVEPAVGERITWPHTEHLKGRAKLVVANVASVTATSVMLSDGTFIPFDFLVLAPGNGGLVGKPTHTTLAARRAFFVAEAARIGAAKSILIVGGGPVGVELAGEIVTDFPGKKVLLVHSGASLMDSGMAGDSFAGKFSGNITAAARSAGVKVLTNARMTRTADGVFGGTTESGEDVSADLVYDCTGSRPSTAFLQGNIPLSPSGYIKVEKTLQVVGKSNVFALGDAADTGDLKQGYTARDQAALVCANIEAALAKRGLKALKPAPVMIFVSVGRKAGVGLLPMCGGCVVGSGMVAGIKSKGLFIDDTRKDHGV